MPNASKESGGDCNQLRVTVIIPCHNHGDMLPAAIQSVLDQGYHPLNIVVVDDGSSDEPWREKYNAHPNIIWIINEQAKGPSAARNTAAKRMWEESDVFMMLDADDLYLPGKIQKSVDKFLTDPLTIGIVYSDAIIKNLNTGTEIHEFREPYDRARLEKECIISNTPLVNKVALGKAGGYNEDMRTCEDWDLWLRITENYVAVHIPEPLHIYHVTGRNSTDVVPIEVWQENWKRIHMGMQQRKNDKLSD